MKITDYVDKSFYILLRTETCADTDIAQPEDYFLFFFYTPAIQQV